MAAYPRPKVRFDKTESHNLEILGDATTSKDVVSSSGSRSQDPTRAQANPGFGIFRPRIVSEEIVVPRIKIVDSETVPELQLRPGPGAKTDFRHESGFEARIDSRHGSNFESGIGSGSKTDFRHESGFETRTDSRHGTTCGTGIGSRPVTDFRHESGFETKTDFRHESGLETRTDSRHESGFETRTDSRHESGFETRTDSRHGTTCGPGNGSGSKPDIRHERGFETRTDSRHGTTCGPGIGSGPETDFRHESVFETRTDSRHESTLGCNPGFRPKTDSRHGSGFRNGTGSGTKTNSGHGSGFGTGTNIGHGTRHEPDSKENQNPIESSVYENFAAARKNKNKNETGSGPDFVPGFEPEEDRNAKENSVRENGVAGAQKNWNANKAGSKSKRDRNSGGNPVLDNFVAARKNKIKNEIGSGCDFGNGLDPEEDRIATGTSVHGNLGKDRNSEPAQKDTESPSKEDPTTSNIRRSSVSEPERERNLACYDSEPVRKQNQLGTGPRNPRSPKVIEKPKTLGSSKERNPNRAPKSSKPDRKGDKQNSPRCVPAKNKGKKGEVQKSLVRNSVGPAAKVLVGPGKVRSKKPGDGTKSKAKEEEEEEKKREKVGSRFEKPEYNSIGCTLKTLEKLESRKVFEGRADLPKRYQAILTTKTSNALDFPADTAIYRDLVNISVKDEEIRLPITRRRTPRRRRRYAYPEVMNFTVPEFPSEYTTVAIAKPRLPENSDCGNVFKISEKIFEWKSYLD